MYDARGRAAKEVILDEHLQLVRKMAQLLKAKLPANVEVDDLIQAGMIGLLDAMRRYQDTQQAQFETYAIQRIKGAMLDELRSMDWLPRSVRDNMRKLEAAISQVEQQLGRQATEADIARQMGVSVGEYSKLLSDSTGHQLLYFEDFHDEQDSDDFLERFFAGNQDNPLDNLIDAGFRDALVKEIEALPEREKLLMGLYYEHELNLKEIGAVMGITESRVSQLHSQAIARIRSKLREYKWTGEV